MKKITIIYWSNGGNVEVLADSIRKGAEEAGAQVLIKLVSEAKVEDVINSDAVAFGSPSMDNNKIEQEEMKPFIDKFKLLPINNKPVVLFGSFGWDNGEFAEKWQRQMTEYEFNVIDKLIVKESPSREQIEKAKELGKKLAEI
ncbi:MAG: flavodoxin [Clostridiaceae bacterium]|nr:flavodoxin [Clostridiaceae bacterium]